MMEFLFFLPSLLRCIAPGGCYCNTAGLHFNPTCRLLYVRGPALCHALSKPLHLHVVVPPPPPPFPCADAPLPPSLPCQGAEGGRGQHCAGAAALHSKITSSTIYLWTTLYSTLYPTTRVPFLGTTLRLWRLAFCIVIHRGPSAQGRGCRSARWRHVSARASAGASLVSSRCVRMEGPGTAQHGTADPPPFPPSQGTRMCDSQARTRL